MLCNVEIPYLCASVGEKHVSRFDITMYYIALMQFVQTLQYLIGNFPYTLFSDPNLCVKMLFYFSLD